MWDLPVVIIIFTVQLFFVAASVCNVDEIIRSPHKKAIRTTQTFHLCITILFPIFLFPYNFNAKQLMQKVIFASAHPNLLTNLSERSHQVAA